MKTATILLVGLLLGIFGADAVAKDRTISKVVKLLQKMLDKSNKETDDDENAYGKYKCYVDTNVAEKTGSIKKLGEQIELLGSKIEELQARNGELSGQTAGLDANMAENKAAQNSAAGVRENSEKAFKGMESDLVKSIGQMQEAVSVLSSIALGQTQTVLRKNKKDAVLLSLGSEAQNALSAVSAILPSESRQYLESFLQSPLSATHSKKGDAIVGVLKNLQATFEGNLVNARSSEAAEKKAFDESIATLKSSYALMEKSSNEKKQNMGDNDGELGSKKTALEAATKQKSDDESFLQKLRAMAAKKDKDYDERKMLRANEDAAIAQAISILNSDEAFSTFGDVDATSTGKTSFLQAQVQSSAVREVERVLEQADSARLSRVASRLRAGNAFSTVLAEIAKMKVTIVKEGAADLENKNWCTKERTNSGKDLDAKKSQIKTLNGAIDKVDDTINDPKTGLKTMIGEKETSLLQNKKAQVDQTKVRKEENKAYQEDVSNLSDAEDLLGKAVAVLNRYYKALDKKMKASLLQLQDSAAPEPFDAYSGQSKSGGEAIKMLEFIRGESKKEHAKANADEKTASEAFEESMTKLKKEEGNMMKALVKLSSDLTEKQKELLEKQTDLKDTTQAKEAIETYLLKIKPGCDFISTNFDLRETSRATETTALDKAVKLIKETPAFAAAVAKEKELVAGKCKKQCRLDKTSSDCKACVAGK